MPSFVANDEMLVMAWCVGRRQAADNGKVKIMIHDPTPDTEMKKTRKSVPRPGSGRRAEDGATDLVQVGVRLTPEQHAWLKQHGNVGLRALIQTQITPRGPE